jgi:murein DD-endopeptidase MepM/ murein hydrolase activator NlpD
MQIALALALVSALVAAPSVVIPAARWQWPLNPPQVIARAYLAPATPYGSGHRGIDIEARSPEVYAPADGVVHFAGVVVDRPVLSIAHPGGILSSFEPVTTTLAAGDTVHRGDIVGRLIAGHCAVITCLHLGVRVGGEYVSPLLFLGGVPRSVLLPDRESASGAWPRGSPRRARGRR